MKRTPVLAIILIIYNHMISSQMLLQVTYRNKVIMSFTCRLRKKAIQIGVFVENAEEWKRKTRVSDVENLVKYQENTLANTNALQIMKTFKRCVCITRC